MGGDGAVVCVYISPNCEWDEFVRILDSINVLGAQRRRCYFLLYLTSMPNVLFGGAVTDDRGVDLEEW